MLYNPPIFSNRQDAGKKLAAKLLNFNFKNPTVFAIPNGGVPVGIRLSQTLSCPLEILIVRKIQIPENPEAGFGAVTTDGTVVLNPEIAPFLGLSKREINTLTQDTINEIKRREKVFKVKKKPAALKGKTVILTDDGLASGYTMLAAIKSVRKLKPKKIIVAVPTASGSAVKAVTLKVDKLITLYKHPIKLPFAVANSYQRWHDLTDKEVLKYLRHV